LKGKGNGLKRNRTEKRKGAFSARKHLGLHGGREKGGRGENPSYPKRKPIQETGKECLRAEGEVNTTRMKTSQSALAKSHWKEKQDCGAEEGTGSRAKRDKKKKGSITRKKKKDKVGIPEKQGRSEQKGKGREDHLIPTRKRRLALQREKL